MKFQSLTQYSAASHCSSARRACIQSRTSAPAAQQGVVLVVSLAMMLIMTLIGVSTMELSSIDTKSIGSTRDGQAAFQAAEAALRVGEEWVDQQADFFGEPHVGDTVDGSILVVEAGFESGSTWWETQAVWDDNGVEVDLGGDGSELGDVAELPKYIIESYPMPLSDNKSKDNNRQSGELFYRVTARGVGIDEDTIVVLQSTYSIVLN